MNFANLNISAKMLLTFLGGIMVSEYYAPEAKKWQLKKNKKKLEQSYSRGAKNETKEKNQQTPDKSKCFKTLAFKGRCQKILQ